MTQLIKADCAQCAVATYTICPTGKRLLKQVKRSWKNWLDHMFSSQKESDLARTGFRSVADAFRKHTGYSWSIYP